MSTAQEKLAQLQAERAELAAARTKEDVRALAEQWLGAAVSRMNGTAGLVLNGHANPEQIQAVIGEFLLDSPALLDFIVARVEATTDLTNRQRASQLKRLDAEIAKVTAEIRETAKAAALAEIEQQFGGVAA